MYVIDNLLNNDTYKKFINIVEKELPYYPYVGKTSADEVDKFQFVHTFIDNGKSISNWENMPIEIVKNEMLPIGQEVNILWAKLNCSTITKEHEVAKYHTDLINEGGKWLTAIYYLNDNNGYTEFENGKKVESIGNRVVVFDGWEKHRAVSQTDTTFRFVMNINFKGELNANI